MYICACKLHLNVDCMIKFGMSKIGRPPIIYQTKFTFSSFYLHMIWPIILLEFFMSDLHFAYLIGNITSEIVVYLYRAFNSSFISLHFETIYHQHSMSSISSCIRHLSYFYYLYDSLPTYISYSSIIPRYIKLLMFKDITNNLFTFSRNSSRCTNSSKCWLISTNLT